MANSRRPTAALPGSNVIRAAGVACALGMACDSTPLVVSDALFRVAASGVPGGSLLGVWGDEGQARAFLVGGFVGVEPSRIPVGHRGRLVEYALGHFYTRCGADAVLWWVHGARDAQGTVVFAVGEDASVLRYRDGRCEPLAVNLSWPEGRPTLWGVWARAPDDVWMVGGSAQPTGPRGVLLHYDGRSFTQVVDLPEAAQSVNLYKITGVGGGLLVVGESSVVLHYDGARWSRVDVEVRASDNRLFTASCSTTGRCYAVGGTGSGIALQGTQTELGAAGGLDEAPGLNGVWAQPDGSALVVGVGGFTALTDGVHTTIPRHYATEASLHGVGGFGSVALAVGGELDEHSPSQRAVVLVRGDLSSRFTFDGLLYQPAGSLAPSRGGSGQ